MHTHYIYNKVKETASAEMSPTLARRVLLFLAGWVVMVATAFAQDGSAASRYADHSVLAEGRWVKIRIPETGVYQITDSLARLAGFSDAAHVSVWGYGGALQPDLLSDDYLRATDDLKPVATLFDKGRLLFHAVGPVNWSSTGSDPHVRNFYSDYGYYFLAQAKEADDDSGTDDPGNVEHPDSIDVPTDSIDVPTDSIDVPTDSIDVPTDSIDVPTDSLAAMARRFIAPDDSLAFVATFYPSPSDYHSFYEVDNYAWYAGGRQLYSSVLHRQNQEYSYQLPAYSSSGSLTLAMVFKSAFTADVYVNDSLVKSITPGANVVSPSTGKLVDGWAKAGYYVWRLPVSNLKPMNTITIKQQTNLSLRLDFMALNCTQPKPAPVLSDSLLPMPEIVGEVLPQDRHADPQADMVIIIPANRIRQAQAERLKLLHEQHDSLRVNIVTADELYNEFASGTPDGNAYRRYMKMLYDRAETEADRPRYLLLFGDGAFDNRLLLSDWGKATQDDYLLCYESENSYSETKCYTSDDYFALLADGKGKNKDSMLRTDLLDLAVGRLPVMTADQAKAVVDKIEHYYENVEAGPWQNLLCFMGDDGNQNMHLNDAEMVIGELEKHYSGYNIQKVYWDAYKRETSTAGDRFPEVERILRQNMKDGALLMDYTGHGGPRSLSHEYVLRIADFEDIECTRLPFWVTASCDIMAFDGHEATIGETAVLSPHGGAIGFFGTARTVYAYFNQYMNRYFTRHLLGSSNGRRNTIGEASQKAKNELLESGDDQTENKFQYVLLGDPALTIAAPTLRAFIDSVNGQPLTADTVMLAAGKRVTMTGRIGGMEDFEGKVYITVFDAEQTILGQMNNKNQTDTAIVFRDYPNIIYTSTQPVSGGRFSLSFTVTRELSYLNATAKVVLYAVSDDLKTTAHGEHRNIMFTQSQNDDEEGEGPNITCYLDTPDFEDGGQLLQQPLFVAEMADEDGINTSGSGIGHDLELVIDKKVGYTYNLNSLFEPLSGDGTRGRLQYRLPVLPYGEHQVRFRAWDVLNNSSSVTLRFVLINPDGIEAATADGGAAAEVFDAAGRPLGCSIPTRKGLYIMRSADGQVKKLTGGRQ